jgi:hypothetical protein
MTVYVSFFTPGSIGSIHAPGVGRPRIRESLTIPASTTATLATGEVALIVNGENGPVSVAIGTTPDADTTTATAASSAGVVIPAGQSLTIVGQSGAKISAKTIA